MESLDSHVFKVHHRNILFIEVVDDIVECGRKRSAESESFIQLLTRGDVVLIVVIVATVAIGFAIGSFIGAEFAIAIGFATNLAVGDDFGISIGLYSPRIWLNLSLKFREFAIAYSIL